MSVEEKEGKTFVRGFAQKIQRRWPKAQYETILEYLRITFNIFFLFSFLSVARDENWPRPAKLCALWRVLVREYCWLATVKHRARRCYYLFLFVSTTVLDRILFKFSYNNNYRFGNNYLLVRWSVSRRYIIVIIIFYGVYCFTSITRNLERASNRRTDNREKYVINKFAIWKYKNYILKRGDSTKKQ